MCALCVCGRLVAAHEGWEFVVCERELFPTTDQTDNLLVTVSAHSGV